MGRGGGGDARLPSLHAGMAVLLPTTRRGIDGWDRSWSLGRVLRIITARQTLDVVWLKPHPLEAMKEPLERCNASTPTTHFPAFHNNLKSGFTSSTLQFLLALSQEQQRVILSSLTTDQLLPILPMHAVQSLVQCAINISWKSCVNRLHGRTRFSAVQSKVSGHRKCRVQG